jgi:hypothetical protein
MNLQEREAELAKAKLDNARRNTVLWVFRQHPDFIQNEANERMILEIIREDIGSDAYPSAESFEIAITANPDLVKQIARQPIQKTKEQIADEIIDLLEKHSRRDEHMLRTERSKMSTWSLEELRARLEELQFKIANVNTSMGGLKSFVRDSRPTPEVKILPAEWTAERIKNSSAKTIRELIKDYGAPLINARLSGKN